MFSFTIQLRDRLTLLGRGAIVHFSPREPSGLSVLAPWVRRLPRRLRGPGLVGSSLSTATFFIRVTWSVTTRIGGDVGRHKSEIMAHRLRLIHPRVEAVYWPTGLGAQVSSQEAGNVHAALAACHLLVDATANPDVFNHLALIATRSNRTLVWGAVYAGAARRGNCTVSAGQGPFAVRHPSSHDTVLPDYR